jgi:hypothetical protein
LRALLLLVATQAVTLAGVEAPLGPYARPGVPVLLRSDAPTVLDLDGWKFRVEGVSAVFPPGVPCVVRGDDGREVLRLEDPGERALTGVIGDIPQGLADAVRIRPDAIADWRALDLFDRLLVTGPVRGDEPWFATVAAWVHAGGSLAAEEAARLFPQGAGLGAVAASIEGLPPARIPRSGNVRPDLYARILPVVARSPALRAARWVVLAASFALALQILVALRGRIGLAALLGGLGAVAVAGAVTGFLRARADFTPLATGRIEISWFGGGVERLRTYLVYRHAGPGAAAPVRAGAAPVLFGSHRAPWWRGPGEEAPLEEGMSRIFAVEEVRRAAPAPLEGGAPPPEVWARERPRRGGSQAAAGPVAPPEASREPPLLLAIRVIAQD